MNQPDLTLYPDEKHKLEMAQAELVRRFEFTTSSGMGEQARADFTQAAKTEFGKVGFDVSVDWQQIHQATTGQPTGVWVPQIAIEGRSRPEEEHDHDRHQWGVVKGLADGQAGYVREDGSHREDPISKIILPKGTKK